MTVRNWFRPSASNKAARPARPSPRCRPAVEHLEAREVPATLSVASATLGEVGTATALVSAGSPGLTAPKDLTLGPDGSLYVTSSANTVLRYNAVTGQLISTFVTPNSGGLAAPFGLAFGPDGNLYVGSNGTNSINRYSGTTGAFLNAFVPAGSGGLNGSRGLAFGPDGNLYVSSIGSASILRYQGPLGASPGSPLPAAGQTAATFVPTASGGLQQPHDLVFGPDGNLDVASGGVGVFKFDGATGAYLTTVVPVGTGGLSNPRGLAFDQDGRLYVADNGTGAIHRYDRQGQYLDDPVVAAGATLLGPVGLIVDSQGALLFSSRDSNAVGRYAGGVAVALSAASPTPVSVDYATADGTAAAGSDYTAQTGTVTFAPGQTSRLVLLATSDDTLVEGNEAFTVQLSNPSGGAAVAAGTATVTIADDEAARQIAIADAAGVEGDHRPHYRGPFALGVPGHQFLGLTFQGGYLYTSPGPQTNGPVDRYDATTGAFVDHFIAAGQISGVRDKVFRNGFWYIGAEYTDEVLRFDAAGTFMGAFVTAGSGGIDGPHGLAFGPDVNGAGVPELYVTGRNSFNVVRYDGATGQPLGALNTTGAGALSYPESLTVGADGVAYVASTGSNQIQKYNAVSGAYLGAITNPALSGPKDVKFGPDGLLYVVSANNSRVERFTTAGGYVDDYMPAGSGGLTSPHRLAFGPDGDVYVTALDTSGQIYRYGTENEVVLTVSVSSTSSSPLTVAYATADGSAVAGSDYVATAGTVTVMPGFTTATVRIPLLNDTTAEADESFTVNLSNATGAVIADGQGVVTVTDDDFTKFFVVNDGSPDQMYRYGAPGNGQTTTALAAGDTAPRGMATTAAGDRVWVADANKTVYVYSAAGALLGSWAAGGLPNNASVEGLATNGTDVWVLVGNTTKDKVYKYSNAAGRLSGSQTAASSFGLTGADTNPKGIVTDGSSFWVVDDGTSTDKVFKYTLTGGLLGSWAIDPANAHPTGLTINPAAPNDIWVVDNGTDRVYQYAAAVGRTSGSQTAVATFALAPGNTNPQDIADPPLASSLVESAPAATVAPFGLAGLIAPVSTDPAQPRPSSAAPVREPEAAPVAVRSAASPVARMAADWFVADGLDLTPIDVDRPTGRRSR
ncbi:MAG: Calx-beta domain-containing protein [Gemmataceae bacterium]